MTFEPNYSDRTLIKLALQEDLGEPFFDPATSMIFAGDEEPVTAHIISKHPTDVMLSGSVLIPFIVEQFTYDRNNCFVEHHYEDGEWVTPASCILTLVATPALLLSLERTILNFLRHLSGIATLTAQFVKAVDSTGCQILDTRKTIPGLRHLEKYAVQCAGGVNHRQGLYDAIMIKDTHVDLCGGMQATLEKLPTPKKLPVIVEVRNFQELETALQFKNNIDRILLDNIRGKLLADCVQRCRQVNMPTEASGNLSLENILEVANSGVNFASVGALTHSAGQVDLSMKIFF